MSKSLRNGSRTDCGCEVKQRKNGRLVDLTGQRFGKLTVVCQAESTPDHAARWHCRCDCGTDCVVRGRSLRAGTATDCGCETTRYYDLTGMRFGMLLVLERDQSRKGETTYWRCLCDCGTECVIRSNSLRSGVRTDCGCQSSLNKDNALIDLTGWRFGKLTVQEKAPTQEDKRTRWVCVCDCGTTCIVTSLALRKKHQQSCGCGKIKDIQGQRFGKLTVLERSDQYVTISGGTRKYQWKCQCDCGNIVYRLSEHLRTNKECSCVMCLQNAAPPKMREAAGFIDGTQVSRIKSTKPTARNQSGVRGVFWNKRTQRWRAMLKFKGVNYYLGEFKELKDAAAARKKAEGIYFGEFLEALEGSSSAKAQPEEK